MYKLSITILRWCAIVFVFQHLKIKAQKIDRNAELTSIVLLGTCNTRQ